MFDRRSFLAVVAGAVAAAATASQAEAGPASVPPSPPAADTPRTIAGLRQGLAAASAEPRDMQYYYRRRYYYRRPVYVVRPRMARRCVWTGYGRVCRWVRVW